MNNGRKRVLILGAAGMDYHVFNTHFRGDESSEVVGFTMAAEQNLGTVGSMRTYPPVLAGPLYPKGIPTHLENDLSDLIPKLGVDEVVFAYSDTSYGYLMSLAAKALAAGASYRIVAPRFVQLPATKPVFAVCAVRTGCGKSQTSRRVYEILKNRGLRVVAIREPMPYGDLAQQVWQRFASYEDLDRAKVTIEEREEYEPYIENGMVIYAGCDYAEILKHAEAEADVIVWDGGNNEIAFYQTDCLIVLTDPLRPGHETSYHPGEVNLRMADVVVINKEDSARAEDIASVRAAVKRANPRAVIVDADSPLTVDDPAAVKGKRVLVIEDGPTVTHGGMGYGAGYVAAKRHGAASLVDPRPFCRGALKLEMERNPQLVDVLPAMGYSAEQLKELEDAINAADCDLVLSGTPIDLARIIHPNKPIVRVRYRLQEKGRPNLEEILGAVLARKGVASAQAGGRK
ncbi:MAG: GTPase [Candidatus Eisenbacteria bacterium]|nr:GTPase [Candidatus Eisenbacteria bacterium]